MIGKILLGLAIAIGVIVLLAAILFLGAFVSIVIFGTPVKDDEYDISGLQDDDEI